MQVCGLKAMKIPNYPPTSSGVTKGDYCFLGLKGQVVEALSVFVSLNKKSCIPPVGPTNDVKNIKLYKNDLIFIIQTLYVSRGGYLATMQPGGERKAGLFWSPVVRVIHPRSVILRCMVPSLTEGFPNYIL